MTGNGDFTRNQSATRGSRNQCKITCLMQIKNCEHCAFFDAQIIPYHHCRRFPGVVERDFAKKKPFSFDSANWLLDVELRWRAPSVFQCRLFRLLTHVQRELNTYGFLLWSWIEFVSPWCWEQEVCQDQVGKIKFPWYELDTKYCTQYVEKMAHSFIG